jgi:hypothetical protein
MQNHVKQRVASLRELIRAGLHQDNLDKLVGECASLSQDSPDFLLFFILKHIFGELAGVLDAGGVSFERYKELTSDVSEQALALLEKVLRIERLSIEDLEPLVSIHIRNVNVFKS